MIAVSEFTMGVIAGFLAGCVGMMLMYIKRWDERQK